MTREELTVQAAVLAYMKKELIQKFTEALEHGLQARDYQSCSFVELMEMVCPRLDQATVDLCQRFGANYILHHIYQDKMRTDEEAWEQIEKEEI